MKKKTLNEIQPLMRKVGKALSANLPGVLRESGYELQRDSEKGWRIPNHGGLIIWERDDGNWGWNQFSTGEAGDTISFLNKFHGMSRKQSIETLALASRSQTPEIHTTQFANSRNSGFPSRHLRIRRTKTPAERWQKNASRLANLSQANLFSNDNHEIWTWLHSRGLKKESIREAQLGWIPDDYWARRKIWGLPDKLKENGTKLKMWLPSGISIPLHSTEGKVIRIRVRRFKTKKPKYYALPGSCMAPLILGGVARPIILCEADLDAWLINQQASDIITSVAVGSSGAKPDVELLLLLILAPKILISLDSDKSGREASRWWIKTFPKAKYWPVPWGKDPSEAFGSAPELIKKWILSGLGSF